MQYVTSVERIGIKKGLQQGLQQGSFETSREDIIEILKTRFKNVPGSIVTALNSTEDLSLLKDLLKKAVTITSLDEFQEDLLGLEIVKK